MSIETVSSSVVAIYLGTDDLFTMGLNMHISSNEARVLVREHLKRRGEKPWPKMEIELFTCPGALLLLARPSTGEIHVFRFGDIEGVIASVMCLSSDPPSDLTYFNNEYYLSLNMPSDSLPGALYEYGDIVPEGEGILSHISEQGKRIISDFAVVVLRESFRSTTNA